MCTCWSRLICSFEWKALKQTGFIICRVIKHHTIHQPDRSLVDLVLICDLCIYLDTKKSMLHTECIAIRMLSDPNNVSRDRSHEKYQEMWSNWHHWTQQAPSFELLKFTISFRDVDLSSIEYKTPANVLWRCRYCRLSLLGRMIVEATVDELSALWVLWSWSFLIMISCSSTIKYTLLPPERPTFTSFSNLNTV